jgi:hypothetical protein
MTGDAYQNIAEIRAISRVPEEFIIQLARLRWLCHWQGRRGW